MVVFCLLAAYNFFFDVFYDSGDSIRHYQFSRWALRHPENLLDLWAKPVFTLLLLPFTVFGYYGAIIFNLLVGTLTCWILVKISEELDYKFAWIIVPLTFFSTIYFAVVNSALTEPLFALVFLYSAYLMIRKNYLWAAIIASMLPFIRSEGYFMIGLFALVLVIRRQWKSIPLLGFTTLIYTIVGGIVFSDFLWLKNNNPYSANTDNIYGKGEFTMFLKSMDYVLGNAQLILMIFGLVSGLILVINYTKKSKLFHKDNAHLEEWVLIFGGFFLYFFAHSFFWWKGGYGSFGLVRVLGGIAPLGSFIAFVGLNFILSLKRLKASWIQSALLILVLAFVLREPFTTGENTYWKTLQAREQVCLNAVNWFEAQDLEINKLFVLYPFIPFIMEKDVFSNESIPFWGLYKSIKNIGYEEVVPEGSFLFWDSSFGPREAELPLDTLLNDRYFELIKSFDDNGIERPPDQESFSVHIFKRVPEGQLNKAEKSYSKEIRDVLNEINTSAEWLEQINLKAVQRGISIDSMKIEDARYILNLRKSEKK